jgi:hypothetical protein
VKKTHNNALQRTKNSWPLLVPRYFGQQFLASECGLEVVEFLFFNSMATQNCWLNNEQQTTLYLPFKNGN